MPNRQTSSRHGLTVWRCIFILCSCLCGSFGLFYSGTAFAHTRATTEQSSTSNSKQRTAATPTIDKVNVGFNGSYQSGTWIPVQVTLSNAGADFSGELSITLPKTAYNIPPSNSLADTYQQEINLPTGAQKQVTLNLPLGPASLGNNATLTVDLLDAAGRRIVSKQTAIPTSNNAVLVGILSDTPNNFDRLNVGLSDLLKTAGQTVNLSAATLPARSELLQNFSVIVLDDFSSSSLSQGQLTALQNWINGGGHLIVAGGPEWQNTLSPLPASLLPVTINGSGTIAAGTSILPVSAVGQTPQNSSPAALPIVRTQARSGSTILQAGENGELPLIVRAQSGQGSIYFIAYDPAIEPLASWQQTNELWKSLLLRTIGNRIITSVSSTSNAIGPQWSPTSSMSSLLQTFFPNAYPSLWLILALLVSYILILGPIRMIIVRRTKKRQYSWRIVLATILLFTLLSYGLALRQKGTSIVNSSITILQLNRPTATGSSGHMTTYLGIFVPNQGDYTVHIPGTSLVSSDQSANPYQPYSQGSSTQQTTITTSQNGTDADLKGVDIWTNRTLVAQHDIHTTGGLISHLQLQQNVISGTVTNTLPSEIDDVYIAADSSYVALGKLPANSTRSISLSLQNTTNVAGNGPATTIADQITAAQGIQAGQGYYPINTNGNAPITDESKQHGLTLEALSGSYCNSNGCYQQGLQPVMINGITGSYITSPIGGNHDPLLLPGAPVTLFGWIKDPHALTALNQAGSDITINGNVAQGTHELLVQAPLDVSYHGPAHIVPGLFSTDVVHLQQDQLANIQEPAQGIYTMTTGALTFEYSLPGAPQLQRGQLNFTTPTNAVNSKAPIGSNTGTTSDINHLQAYLYNWHTGNWDSVTFNQYALSVPNAQDYCGPNDRILLSLSNQDSRLGTIPFSLPNLTIDGTFAN
jgi:Protein of unknown function (DUF1355).